MSGGRLVKFKRYSPIKTLSLKQGHRGDLGNTNLEGGHTMLFFQETTTAKPNFNLTRRID
jgi:hypothetical protein